MSSLPPLDPTSVLLLRAVLLDDAEAAAAAGRDYLASVDVQVIPWSQSRLMPTLYKRMAALGEPTQPLLRGTYRQAWTRNQKRFRATVATITALEQAGIPTLVLKGAALVPAYGGDWGVRDMSDVDLLVAFEHLDRAIPTIEAHGWLPARGLTTAGVLARYLPRRHSWNFEHPDGHQLDLHWRVFTDSRGPWSDRSFFAASVPLELGSVRARRMGDADLLLHVLEHAGHHEPASQLQWVVDATQVLRDLDDVAAATERLAQQARSHRLVGPLRDRLVTLLGVIDEPAARAALVRLEQEPIEHDAPPGSLRDKLDQHRRGGTPLPLATVSLARAAVDGSMAHRRAAWLTYVASGRRPAVERFLVAHGGRLTTTPSHAVPATDDEGWWHLDRGETVEALCGPGWSYPETGTGAWVEGVEGRLSLPLLEPPAHHADVEVELYLTVLGRYGGPDRTVAVRAAGETLATLTADEVNVTHRLRLRPPPPHVHSVELSVLVTDPARPVDLGVGPDPRHLGALVHRVRVLIDDEVLQPTG